MFTVSYDSVTVRLAYNSLPDTYAAYCQHAQTVDEFNIKSAEGAFCFVAVSSGTDWPELVVAQKYSPSVGGFYPGILFIPETKILLIGAGERVLAYRLDPARRLWEDKCDCGFWGWARHGNHVLMSAELELTAFDLNGKKCWTTFVEPPWNYRINEGLVQLDVMGRTSHFSLSTGPTV